MIFILFTDIYKKINKIQNTKIHDEKNKSKTPTDADSYHLG